MTPFAEEPTELSAMYLKILLSILSTKSYCIAEIFNFKKFAL
uniref:Uncharacterized protein n=1 Tax=Heterorhabditis bacteriophora TaxID=37862 RepID=A0A1I7WXB7_HETBA